MKRNLFAVFLAVMLVSALVFFVAPSAKAADATVVQATGTVLPEGFDFDANILDLNGNNVEVTVPVDKTLRVIDTANKKEDNKVGTLTNNGTGAIAKVAQDPSSTMHFVAIATTAENVTTYQFHPFNLMISQVGINTIAKNSSTKDETDTTVAVCLRGTYGANNAVLDSGVITDYGLCTVKIVDDKYEYGTPISAKSKYAFDEKIMHAYFDLANLLETDNIDSTFYYCTYITVNGEPVYSPVEEITPREVLKKINKDNITPTDAQKDRLETLFETNKRVANILTNMQAQEGTATLDFTDKANRVSQTTDKQVWVQNGITFTNNKAGAQTNVADYADPARFYKNSEIIIEASGITKVTFDCNKSEHATNLKTSLESADIAYEESGNTITINCDATNAFTLKLSGGAVWLNSIVVSANFAPECAHIKNLSEATCSAPAVCIDCDQSYGDTIDHVEKTAATCTAKAVCNICGNRYGELADHKYDTNGHTCDFGCGEITGNCEDKDPIDSICDYCEKPIEQGGTTESGLLATFEFGANGSATHKDGTEKTIYSETDGNYTLQITDGSKIYTGAYDATGKSAIKFGTSSATGSLKFTVPDGVNKVIIYMAGYKTSTVTVNVNNVTHIINTLSDNGAYTAIEVDTSSAKTVTVATTTNKRAMMDKIEFYGLSSGSTEDPTEPPTEEPSETPSEEPSEPETPSEPTEKIVTLTYSGSTTNNMTGNNDAATLGLDATIFSAIGNKGGTSNNVGLNKAGQIRLYANKSDGNGTTLTVSVAEGYTIKSIKITFTSASNAKNCAISGADGTVIKTTTGDTSVEVDINGRSFMLQNVLKDSTTQIYIASIEITYYCP